MKRNPQTKIKISDSSPVMHCRTIRRRKMSGSDDSQAWGMGVTLVPQEKLDVEEMERIPYSHGYYRPTRGHFGRE